MKPLVPLAAALMLAGGAGFLASTALSSSSQATRTVTINVGTGGQGPPGPKGDPGPPGPPGPAGSQKCPDGFELTDVVINHPGGQTVLFTCVKG